MSTSFNHRADDIYMRNTSSPNSEVTGSASRVERPAPGEKKTTRYYYRVMFDEDDRAVLLEARKVFVIHKKPLGTITAQMDRKTELSREEWEWIKKEVACA